jgi:DNA-binding NarL/FixJ family response regulator
MHDATRILVVDDHPILRHGIAQLINREPDLVVAAEAGGMEEALAVLASLPIDLAVVDISLEGLSGLELLKALRQRHPSVRALVLSMHDETVYAERVLRVGARGYIMKQEATKKIVPALREIRSGAIHLSERMRQRLLSRFAEPVSTPDASPLARLSDRELEVFRLIGKGMKTGDIARHLNRSVNTIEAHRAGLKRKLAVTSGPELARLAFRLLETAPPEGGR